jgi:hypothetical protein
MVGTVGVGTLHCLGVAAPLTVGGAMLFFDGLENGGFGYSRE